MRLGPGGDGHLLRSPLGYVAIVQPAAAAPARSEDCHGPSATDLRDALRVKPGSRVRLERRTRRRRSATTRRRRRRSTCASSTRLADLQDRLWAEAEALGPRRPPGDRRRRQGRHDQQGHGGVQPAGLRRLVVQGPDPEELAHDFLWRIHKRTPGKGEIGIFNRSHYEDVLVVRVHELVPRGGLVGALRPDQRVRGHAGRNGTTIVKFFLSIDRDEQRERFQARYDDPTKRWKFSLGDLEERKRWDDYQAAFDDALSKTSTDAAPWYVIPANRKWFRNLAVATILADTIAELRPDYPPAPDLPAEPRHRVARRASAVGETPSASPRRRRRGTVHPVRL